MTITPDTQITITIGLVASCILTAVVCTWKLASRIAEAEAKWDKVNEDLEKLAQRLGDSYTLTRASEVALRHAIENPTHRVPDPRNPHRVISVNHSEVETREKSILDT